MTFRELEAIDHGHIHYNLRSKLWEHILKRSEVCFAKNAAVREQIRTKEALDAYTSAMWERLIDRLGGIPYDSTLPLQAQITGTVEETGLRIENIVFQSRPNVYVTANLYLPVTRKKSLRRGITADGAHRKRTVLCCVSEGSSQHCLCLR